MDGSFGIKACGVYVPRLRMERSAIAHAHKWMAPGLASLAKGRRAFASWDEDAVTMAVEAGRSALAVCSGGVEALHLVSTTLPFADLQNASLVNSALRLGPAVRTLDIGNSQRAATSALLEILRGASADTLLLASDMPPAKPASTQEMSFGAGAAALMIGKGDLVARLLGAASRTEIFVDHFRSQSSNSDYAWEERWVREEGYLKLIPPTVAAALADAGCEITNIDHLVLASPLRGIADAVARALGFTGTLEDQLAAECGYAGAAHPLLMLAAALDGCKIGARILLVGFGQGCDALVLEKLGEPANKGALAASIADARPNSDYLRMLAFRGLIDLEWGMRAEIDTKTALTEAYRSRHQMAGFVAGKCGQCDTVQFPQLPYCVNPACGCKADFVDVPLADEPASIFTITADSLTFYMSPPAYVGFVQFENGARVLMEVVDVGPDGVEIGEPVRMAYRIKEHDHRRGFRRYFWKAVPIRSQIND